MVVDTSALLAVFFHEKKGSAVAKILESSAAELRMSTVNLAEVLVLLQDRQPQLALGIQEELFKSSIRFVPPSIRHAQIASDARMRFPLNLGDCFAYALAMDEGCPILTLDKDFRKTDASLVEI